MLAKTANGLYWMYRYLERAENITRLIETGQRIALTRLGNPDEEWTSILQTAGALESYSEAHDAVTKDAAIDWMLRAPENPSSVRSALAAARQNGRMVRTGLTADVWEALNSCHMDANKALTRKVNERDLPGILKMIRQRTALVRGATDGTLLRNDIYDFARLGTFMERADNTARILDVKYYVLLPSATAVGSAIDNVQWETILLSVSGRGGYRMEYGGAISSWSITEFLILNGRMPRSLVFCLRKIRANLGYLGADTDEDLPSYQNSQHLITEYLSCDVDEIFDRGLHEYLQAFLHDLRRLGQQIETDYRFYE